MDINKFIEQTAGNWFSQRTTYQILQNKVENSKANLAFKILSPQDPQVAKILEGSPWSESIQIGAIACSWDNSPDWGKGQQKGSSMFVLIAPEDNAREGNLLFLEEKAGAKVIAGGYCLGEDEALTLVLKDDDHELEERIWFASPNLRLRTSILKYQDSVINTSFYSEIRQKVKN